MNKNKKRIAIICVIINIIMITQICIGNVSAFYDNVVSLFQNDEMIETIEELQPSDICQLVDASTMRCFNQCEHKHLYMQHVGTLGCKCGKPRNIYDFYCLDCTSFVETRIEVHLGEGHS